MATDPRIALSYQSPQFTQPGVLMALKNVSQDANLRHAEARYGILQKVKEQALSAYDQAPDAPEPERQRRYGAAWQAAMDAMEKSGMANAAGFSAQDIQSGRTNVIPPEQARAMVVSLGDIGKKEREGNEYLARMTKYGNEAREITRREQKDSADQKKAQEKHQTQQAGQLYFTALQQAIASGASDEEADAVGKQALSQAGPQAASFDPEGMAVSDEGEFIKTGAMQVAKRAAPITPGDGPELSPLGPKMGTGEDYDWRKAYLYNASVNSKFNPQTAKTLIDYRTGRVIPNEPVIKASERVAKAGASSVSVGADWGKPATNKLQEATIDTAEGIKRLTEVKNSFDRSYLTYGKQLGTAIDATLEKLGKDLSPQKQKALVDYTRFKRRTLSNLNLYIKAITGAAMSETEAVRITNALPNMDDSSSQFKSKLDDVIEELQDKLDAYGRMLNEGPNSILPAAPGSAKSAPKATVAPKSTWSTEDQDRLDELERKYGK